MTDDDDKCGYSTGEDSTCSNPAGDDGRCWIPTHGTDADDDTENPQGRDTKLTRQRQENIAAMLEDSHSIAAVCRCNGIDRSTFYEWLQKGDAQEEGIYAEFSDRVARARGAGERELVDEIMDKAREKGDTRTMLSVLKSRYPDSWGDAETSDEGGTVNIHLSPTDQ